MPKDRLPLYHGGNLKVNQLQVTSGTSFTQVAIDAVTGGVAIQFAEDSTNAWYFSPNAGALYLGESGVGTQVSWAPGGTVDFQGNTVALGALTANTISVTAQPRCRLGTTINVKANPVAQYTLAWGTEVFDTGACHSTANNTRITAPTDGLYHIHCHIDWEDSSDSVGTLEFLRNGVVHVTDLSVGQRDQDLTLLDDASAGVYWETRVSNADNASLNVYTGASLTWFEAVKLA
jgi:hypothetical protein